MHCGGQGEGRSASLTNVLVGSQPTNQTRGALILSDHQLSNGRAREKHNGAPGFRGCAASLRLPPPAARRRPSLKVEMAHQTTKLASRAEHVPRMHHSRTSVRAPNYCMFAPSVCLPCILRDRDGSLSLPTPHYTLLSSCSSAAVLKR